MCVFSQIKYMRHIKRDVYSVTWVIFASRDQDTRSIYACNTYNLSCFDSAFQPVSYQIITNAEMPPDHHVRRYTQTHANFLSQQTPRALARLP